VAGGSGPFVLAVDQGTSATKAVVFDARGRPCAKAASPLASGFPRPGFVEQDPSGIFRNVLDAVSLCLEALRREVPDGPGRISCCGISNQRETFLLWDGEGRPLCPAIGWQCRRSVPVCDRLRKEGMEGEIRRRTGLLLDPYFSATKLLWLMENDPDARRAVDAGGARFGTVDTWLLWNLSGGASFATDRTNASRTLLYDLSADRWDRDLMDRWGLSALRMPEVRPSAYAFGETDFRGLLPHPVPIAAMIGDSHAAAFGEGCFSPGTAKATMGTGSSILMNVGGRRVHSAGGMVSTICWSTRERTDHALEGIVVTCGATIQWMRDRLGLFAESRDTEAMARAVPDDGGVRVVPAFAGMGAPWWRPDMKAAITGLTLGSTKNHIVRAALESVAYQVADVVEAMGRDAGVAVRELAADGGLTSNRFVMQLLADLLGVDVVNRGIEEVSALGAACLAGLETGLFRDLEELASFDRQERRFRAGAGSGEAKRCHEEWKQAVRTLL